MKTRILTITILLITSIAIGNSQDVKSPKKNKYVHAVGANAGFTTGVGLSYRYMPKRFGVQATFGVIGSSFGHTTNAGLTFIIKLINSDDSFLFLYQGSSLYRGYEINSIEQNSYSSNRIQTGIGIGAEGELSERIAIYGNAGFGMYNNAEYTSLDFGIGVIYKFQSKSPSPTL